MIKPANIPPGAILKGIKDIQCKISFLKHVRNIQYLIARWQLPDGSYITDNLPQGIHGHYGPELLSYILYQTHACRVTEDLLHGDLLARGILISTGLLNNLLIKNKGAFHEEVEELLSAGTVEENQIEVDDTGGRHKGKNQYTTVYKEWA